MKVKIQDYCIRCGLCVDLYPELFKLNYDEDVLEVLHDEIPADLEDRVRSAAKDCSIAAIILKKQ